jgi:hypothetical protein
MNETDLTTDEAFLLHRLSTDDGQYGECCGNALDSLMDRGLVEWKRRDPRGNDYGWVGLTQEGINLARLIKPA